MVDLSLIENAPEDRESLTNLFSQGRYSDFGKQLGQMVTPQSFYGNKLDLDTVLNDFVEFSPYGDVKDAWSAFNPNSGLDWLERTIAALPIVGWGAGATLATRAAMRNIEMRRQLKQQGEAVAASLSTSNELGIEASMVGAEGRLEYPGELSGEDIGFTEETTTAERTNEAARLSAMVWKHTMPEASVAMTSTFDELGLFVEEVGESAATKGSPFTPGLPGIAAAALRTVGKMLIQSHDGMIPVGDKQGDFTPEVRELVAAQVAVGSALRAANKGILLDPRTMKPIDQAEIAAGLSSVNLSAKYTDMIYQLEAQLLERHIGPDLVSTPQTKIEAIVADWDTSGKKSAATKPILITSIATELQPTTRLVDRNTNFVVDSANLADRNFRMEYEALTGDFAANLLNSLLLERKVNPERAAISRRWYHNASATLEHLAEVTGRSKESLAGLFSALSPQTDWAPSNLVAGIHVALEYTRPDLQVGSVEYATAFIEAIDAGAWREDLWVETTDKVRKAAGGKEGIAEYYADRSNFLTEKGDKLRGFETQAKQNAAYELLKLDVDWPVITRHMKTHNFTGALIDPFNMYLVAIDTHQYAAIMGTVLFGESIASGKGSRKLGSMRQGVLSDESFAPPGSTSQISTAQVADLRQRYIDSGHTEAQADAAVERARTIPNEEQLGRYVPAATAHQIVRQLVGADTTSSVQAEIWFPIRALKEKFNKARRSTNRGELGGLREEIEVYVQELVEEGLIVGDDVKMLRVEALKAVYEQAVWDNSVIDHMEGTPGLLRGIAGQTTNAFEGMESIVPAGAFEADKFQSVGQKKSATGSAILMVSRPDGTVEVWADPTIDGVRDSLRNLAPTGLENGQYQRYVPRAPRQVGNIEAYTAELTSQADESGYPVAGQARSSATGTQPALMPGNRFVFEFAVRKEAEAAVARLQATHPGISIVVQQAEVSRHGRAVRPVTAEELVEWNAQDDGGPFDTNDWVSISAHTEANTAAQNAEATARLQKALRSAVRRAHPEMSWQQASDAVIRQEGTYGGAKEASFVVFGLPYDTAINLAKKYKQASIATRNAYIVTTGENAGTYHASTNEITMGKRGTFSDDFSALEFPDGRVVEYQGDYDWKNPQQVSEAPNELMTRTAADTKGTFQVVVDVGGVESSLSWDVTDNVWRAGSEGSSSSAAYLHGKVWQPPKTVRVHEHVYVDRAGRSMAWRTSQDVNTQSRHQYDVFVPEQEARTLSRRSNDAAAGVRTPRQASAVRSEPDANNTVMVGGDVQIEYGIHEDAEVNVPARQVFAAFIGKKELHTVVHLGGQTPRLAKTPSNLATAEPTAGVAYVSGTKKNGYTVRAYDRNEAVAVRDVLTAVGVPVGNFRTRVGPDRAGMVMKDVRETRHASDLEMSPRYKNQDMNKVDAELGHELSQDLGQKVPFEMGDNASVRDRRVLAGNYSVMNGGSLTTASPAVQAHVDRYGPLPQSFLDEKFQGGGVRAAFTDEPRTLGFSPTYGKQSRRVLGVWITDRFAGASATMGDLEYRFGLDKARWPVLPNEQGAAMDAVYMHETGHNIQNWFKWQGAELALNLRTNQMLAEVGGEAGITRLVSDYAITSRNEMFSEILARSIHDPSMDRSLVSFIEDVYAGMRATEEWYATKDKSSPDLETAVLDAMNVKETR